MNRDWFDQFRAIYEERKVLIGEVNLGDPTVEEALYDSKARMDNKLRIVHSFAATPANVHDSHLLPELLHGDETCVCASG